MGPIREAFYADLSNIEEVDGAMRKMNKAKAIEPRRNLDRIVEEHEPGRVG